MSQRYQAGIILPGYNALKVADAPTIGTATSASGTSVSVTFTAPSCVGGGAISSYKAYCTTTGTNIATGASSPLVVTGLTTGTAYTFRVSATNAFGPSYPSAASNSATPSAIGQDAYTTAGCYTWVAPAGVTSVSAVAVGGGGYIAVASLLFHGGGGGALAYANNIAVTPGNSYTVSVGAGGLTYGNDGGTSYFINTSTVSALGGGSAIGGGLGGTVQAGTGGSGGKGGAASGGCYYWAAGGGAGGYAGAGGAGANSNDTNGGAGSGGGAGGGYGVSGAFGSSGGGGGVGILGQGSSGAGGTVGANRGGGGGSGGTAGYPTGGTACTCSGRYGGGAGREKGTRGAVRIIYPGTTRQFPSTNTGDL